MDKEKLYKYAYWGVSEHIKVLTCLYEMCKEVGDGDAMDEYKIKIEKAKADFKTIVLELGFDFDSCVQVLDWEIRKEFKNDGR